MPEVTSTYMPGQKLADTWVLYPEIDSYFIDPEDSTSVQIAFDGTEQRRIGQWPIEGRAHISFRTMSLDPNPYREFRDFRRDMRGAGSPFYFFDFSNEPYYRESLGASDGSAFHLMPFKEATAPTEVLKNGVATGFQFIAAFGTGGEDRLKLKPDVACSVTKLTGGGSLSAGAYTWSYTWVISGVETSESPASNSITASANDRGSLTAIAVGPTGTTARKIYRTTAGGATRKLVTTINDNTTTTLIDGLADGSLGANAPTLIAGDALTATFSGRKRFVVRFETDRTRRGLFRGGRTATPRWQFDVPLWVLV